MINEIFPDHFNNEFRNLKDINEDDYIFHFNEKSLFLKINGDKLEIPRKKDIQGITGTTEKTYLFKFNDHPCFLILDNLKTENKNFVYHDIHSFRTFKQKEIAWLSLVAFNLMNWYSQNKFCGKCGSMTKEKPDERAIICTSCDNIIFPKISPAIIVAIVCNNEILLANNSNFPGSWYSHVAGYADIGESLEEAVIREVKEEVGIDVKNIRYYKSQPWPLSGTMMIGFVAQADRSQMIQVDNREITYAAWFSRGNLPNHPPTLSIAGEMIDRFEKGEL